MKRETAFTPRKGQRFHIHTLGCKINQYEAEALREAWLSHGLSESSDASDADVIVVNACAVTAKAVADVRAAARAAHRANPEAAVVVVGCVPEADREAVAALPGVAVVLPQRAKAALADLRPTVNDEGPAGKTFPPLAIADYPRARAVLKVQDGCSHRCSYCIVPLMRGPSVSRAPEEVVAEARRLLDGGFREITLSGVNLRQFGMGGLGGGWNFWKLVRLLERELAPEWAGRARLRISSLDPAQLGDEALETLADLRPAASDDGPAEKTFPPLAIADYPRARAVLKVQDGCSHMCSYCIVPLMRGPSVSRAPEEVVAEARRLLDGGFREITLSGVNLRQFGMGGLGGGWNFWKLVRLLERELAPEWAGRARLRISSLDPAQLGDEALETLAESRLVAPHLHLSLQSLAPDVLLGMRRGHYGPEHVHRFLDRLGQVWPVFGLGADFIAGFPGETEADAARTVEQAAALPLSYAHVFPYSQRPGTPAAALDGQVPDAVKKERAARLRSLVARKRQAFLKRQARLPELTVVLEDDDPWRGRNEFYVECRLTRDPASPARRGLVRCRPVEARQGCVLVEPLDEEK